MKKRLFALALALMMLVMSGCSVVEKLLEPEKEDDLAQKLEQAMQQAEEEKQQEHKTEQPEADNPELPTDPMLWTTETEHLVHCRMPEVEYGENGENVSVAWNFDGMALMKVSRERVNEVLALDFENSKSMQEERFAGEAEKWPGFDYYHLEFEVDDYGTPCRYTGVAMMSEEWIFRFDATVEIEDGELYLELVDQVVDQLYVDGLSNVIALAQSVYEGGNTEYETSDYDAYAEYAALLNDFWAAENYADEQGPYVWYFTEDGTVFLSYEDYYTYPDNDASTVEWGLSDNEELKEAYFSQCDPDFAYEPESGSEDVLYILNPRGTANGGAYALPLQLNYTENILTVYWGYDEVQTFYRVGSDRASDLLRGTVYEGELPVLHYAYLRIDDVNQDGSFVAALEEVLFLGWDDEELLIEYGIDPEDVTNDYVIVQINEGSEITMPVQENAELSVIDWSGELGGDPDNFVFGVTVDNETFCDSVMTRYKEYGTRSFVTYSQQGGAINHISEVYLP